MKYQQTGTEESTLHYSCSGSIENSNDFRFLEEVLGEGNDVVLDMAEIDYINSCGFGAIVEETMNFSDAGSRLSVISLRPEVRKTLAILGGEELLHYLD